MFEFERDHYIQQHIEKLGKKPNIIGMYWNDDETLIAGLIKAAIEPLSTNTTCIDYSVARKKGRLVAYRWNGEQTLSKDNFIFVNREN